MQSANLSGPLKGLRPYQALIGPTQASGLAGGFDFLHIITAKAHSDFPSVFSAQKMPAPKGWHFLCLTIGCVVMALRRSALSLHSFQLIAQALICLEQHGGG